MSQAVNTTGISALVASTLLLAPAVHTSAQASPPPRTPALAWGFDESTGDVAAEKMHHADGKLSGIYAHVPGLAGDALRLDGETSGVEVKAASMPALGSSFTVEAWIAIDAYPWNWAPIADQRKQEKAGFLFGIDSFGHLGLQAEIGGKWQKVTASKQLPLKKWVHVAAAFSESSGMALYVNGKAIESKKTKGKFVPAAGADLLMGRVRHTMLPAQWLHPKYKVWYSFDGILDEVSLFDHALTAEQIATEYSQIDAEGPDPLSYPKLPSGPPGPAPFGATYATLKYDELWDAARRVGRDSDVVVRFDDAPVRFVSWQGTNYIPAWVTEDGKWYSDEFVETYGAPGCPAGEDCEPMSDKQNRYAHVRILENTAARTVIHVRYGQCEVEEYLCAHPDPVTGWTDSADEYYTVYPDEVAARKSVSWSSSLNKAPEFQETIVINQPGTRPEDNIQTDALTFVNMKGEAETYSWLDPPKTITEPAGANIQMVNLISNWKPFQIVLPDHPRITTYFGEKTYSIFEWWNHWPVAQVKSSGISAVAPDRPSHSSLSHIESEPWQQTADSMTKIMLVGMSDRPPAELVALAHSWATPPEMTLEGSGYKSNGYDPSQRAFVLRQNATNAGPVQLTFHASADSPLVDPALVIENWGEAAPKLTVNGKPLAWGKDARYGLVGTLDRSTLVVWLRLQAESETSIVLGSL